MLMYAHKLCISLTLVQSVMLPHTAWVSCAKKQTKRCPGSELNQSLGSTVGSTLYSSPGLAVTLLPFPFETFFLFQNSKIFV